MAVDLNGTRKVWQKNNKDASRKASLCHMGYEGVQNCLLQLLLYPAPAVAASCSRSIIMPFESRRPPHPKGGDGLFMGCSYPALRTGAPADTAAPWGARVRKVTAAATTIRPAAIWKARV